MRPVAWRRAGPASPAGPRRRCSPGPEPVLESARGVGRCHLGARPHGAAPVARASPTAPACTPARVAPRFDVQPRPRTALGRSPSRHPPARAGAAWPPVWLPSAAPRSPPALAAAARSACPAQTPPLRPALRARSGAHIRWMDGPALPVTPEAQRWGIVPRSRVALRPGALRLVAPRPGEAKRLPSLLACSTPHFKPLLSVWLLLFAYLSSDKRSTRVVHRDLVVTDGSSGAVS